MPVTLYAARVKYGPQPKPMETQYGPRINVVATLEQTGEDIKLWGNPDSAIAHLKKGETVSLAKTDKGNWEIASFPNEPKPAPSDAPPPGYQPQQNKTVASQAMEQPPRNVTEPGGCDEDVKQWVWLYLQLKTQLPEASEVTWRSGASTLYIARQKIAQCLLAEEK